MTWLAANLAPVMFGALVVFLLTGFPVAFSLAACGMFFGFIGIELGMIPVALMQALPLRLVGIIQNETLLAIPFFTFMGLILERSGMAEDLLETVGQVFGPVRGGLALAVVLVGAMLAATTGVVAASVISMGLISLPIMLRYGYSRPVATGVITASGTLAQIIPPSLVLIVIADQLGRSVGDMYQAAFIPAFLLVGVYCLFIVGLAVFRPSLVPALPPEARIYRESSGSSGHRSLFVLFSICIAAGILIVLNYVTILTAIRGVPAEAPLDEAIVMALSASTILAFLVALLAKLLRLNFLSQLAQQVTFVLIPPLLLIFLVLGTIFLGIATPTEGGAMGAVGALVLAVGRRKLSFGLLRQALNTTAKLSCFVLFVLIGSTIFSLTFQGIDGPKWVEHLFDKLPGGQLGFLILVNTLIFFLGFFIDFFEIAFILLPLLAPVADKMGIDLIWFGIMIAMNLQTSFLTPPFGFALFYLRSVAPAADYDDRVTKKRIRMVSTADIYRGSVAFVIMQLIMLVVVIAVPSVALYALGPKKKLDTESITIEVPSETPAAGAAKPDAPDNKSGEPDAKSEEKPDDKGNDPFKVEESGDKKDEENNLGGALSQPAEGDPPQDAAKK